MDIMLHSLSGNIRHEEKPTSYTGNFIFLGTIKLFSMRLKKKGA